MRNAAIEPHLWKYMSGRCYDFALALGELVDNPVFVAVGTAEEPLHVALKISDNLFADVRGFLTGDELVQGLRYGPTADEILEVDRWVLEFHCGLTGVEPPYDGSDDIEEAREATDEVFPQGIEIGDQPATP